MSVILTDEQLFGLTKRRRKGAQCRALDAMGVPYRRRPDGSPVVFTSSLMEQRDTREPVMRFDNGGRNATKKERPRTAALRLS
jgi:hypothetical protein